MSSHRKKAKQVTFMKNTRNSFIHEAAGRIFGGLTFTALLLALPCARGVDVLTHMNDNNRSGANTSETILTPANVNQSTFGKLWSYSVNGATYAQPLYVSGVNIGGGTHNVVYIETMEDDAYAFDADNNTLYWHVSFLSSGLTPVPVADIAGSSTRNIVGDVGVESTPYIDKAGGTIYMVSRTKKTSNSTYFQTLHALDLATGAEKLGGPVNISASGFSAKMQNQRMGLALAGGNIIISWASHEDHTPYNGWMIAYNASTLAQAGTFNDTPSGTQGGIWQQGRAPAVDASGNVYVVTGNGTWDGSRNFGESFLKLSSSLSLLDWFTPDNYSTLNAGDEDLGSSGAMLIPGANLVIAGGKQGTLFSLNTGNLGHEKSGNGQVVQSIANFAANEMHGGVVYWNSAVNGQLIFDWANSDNLKAFKFNGSTIATTPYQKSSASSPGTPGGFLSISANGSTSGILWASLETADNDSGTVAGILRAYNADNISGTELWDSQQNASRDSVGNFVKDANPLVANGKVYVGSYGGAVSVYGLLGSGGGTIASGTYKIINRNSGLALDANLAGTTNGTLIDQYTYQAHGNQQWVVTSLGGGQYSIAGVQSGKVLDVTGGSDANGAQVELYTNHSGSNQKWVITASSGGYYIVQNVDSGKLLDVVGASTKNSALVDQWTNNGGNNQQWSFQAP
jgi:hypothetical protein